MENPPNNITAKLLVLRTENTYIQLFRYLFVGAVSASVDMGTFYLMQRIFGMHYLSAQTAGFMLGVTANYLLSVIWVFRPTDNRRREILLFFLVGFGGLLLSYLLLWLLIDRAHFIHFHNMAAKTVVIALVLIWNFGMRKKFIF